MIHAEALGPWPPVRKGALEGRVAWVGRSLGEAIARACASRLHPSVVAQWSWCFLSRRWLSSRAPLASVTTRSPSPPAITASAHLCLRPGHWARRTGANFEKIHFSRGKQQQVSSSCGLVSALGAAPAAGLGVCWGWALAVGSAYGGDRRGAACARRRAGAHPAGPRNTTSSNCINGGGSLLGCVGGLRWRVIWS